jgi:hypothetical protein
MSRTLSEFGVAGSDYETISGNLDTSFRIALGMVEESYSHPRFALQLGGFLMHEQFIPSPRGVVGNISGDV